MSSAEPRHIFTKKIRIGQGHAVPIRGTISVGTFDTHTINQQAHLPTRLVKGSLTGLREPYLRRVYLNLVLQGALPPKPRCYELY